MTPSLSIWKLFGFWNIEPRGGDPREDTALRGEGGLPPPARYFASWGGGLTPQRETLCLAADVGRARAADASERDGQT